MHIPEKRLSMKIYYRYCLKIQFDFFWKIKENISDALIIVYKVALFQMQNLKGKNRPGLLICFNRVVFFRTVIYAYGKLVRLDIM